MPHVLAFLFAVAVAAFVLGMLVRVGRWLRTPVPLRTATTPGPRTRTGVLLRLAGDTFLFTSLLRDRRAFWLTAWLFHVALAVVLWRHLRYFLHPVPEWVLWARQIGVWAGYVLGVTLLLLLLRRLVHPRVLFISILSDYAILALLLLIAASGIAMRHASRPDLVHVKSFVLNLAAFRVADVPLDRTFALHFASVAALLAWFPFSKLAHAAGGALSPTRNQRDDVRERRHVNPWDADA